jgi:hypothetical protein
MDSPVILMCDELAYTKAHYGLDVPSEEELREFLRYFYQELSNEEPDINQCIPEMMQHTGMSQVQVERIIMVQTQFLISVDLMDSMAIYTHRYPIRCRTKTIGRVREYTWQHCNKGCDCHGNNEPN